MKYALFMGLVLLASFGFSHGGNPNTRLGEEALYNLTTGQGNVAIGAGALHGVTTADGNVAVGMAAGYLTNGAYNVAVGTTALRLNTTGTYNVAIGTDSMYHNRSGNNNMALGYDSLYNNLSGNGNVALGFMAGYANDPAWSNCIAIGMQVSCSGASQAVIGNGETQLVHTRGYLMVDTQAAIPPIPPTGQAALYVRDNALCVRFSDGTTKCL